jgi:acylglycerol lipase
VEHIEFRWRTSDGLQLFAQGWRPRGECRAVVCLVHGLGEHTGRYGHVAVALSRAGYALLGFDLRGHGRSEGQRGHAPSLDDLLDDMTRLLEEATQRFLGCPAFLYGHSLGGSLVLDFALRRRPHIAGVIATGPLLRTAFTPPAWKTTLGRLLYGVWPTLSLTNGLDITGLSRDAAVVSAYANDPLVHDRVSARLGMDMLDSGEWALARASAFPLPLLLMHGGADRITSAEASRQFAESAPDSCTLRIWDGLYHEIHNEPEQRQVFDVLIEWLGEHVPTSE